MNYDDVVKMIKESNAKVDEVLKAAKLQRCQKQPMSKEMLAMILNYCVGTLGMVLVAAAVFMFFYFMGT